MNKVYLVAPLAGLLAFGGYYWKHARAHELHVAEIERKVVLEKEKKRLEREGEHLRAMEQAKITIARRTAEREEKERLEAAQKQTRLDLEQRRNAAGEMTRKLRPQIDRLRFELEGVQVAIVRLDERKRELQEEQAFLTTYVREAEANRQSYYHLVEKLEAAERARAAAAPAPSVPGKS